MTIVAERVETLVLARLASPSKKPPSIAELVEQTQRYRPTTHTEAQWRDLIQDTLAAMIAQQRVTPERRVAGEHAAKPWRQWTDKLLPALALGVALDDAKGLKRLAAADGLVSAIAARELGLWGDGPPSFAELCNGLVWRDLAVEGAPKNIPGWLRVHVLRKYIEGARGSAEKLVKQIAAKAVGAPRADAKAIRDSLVRGWLDAPDLVAAIRDVVDHARDGVFGDRKVFVAAAWHQLRARPAWARLALDDFKAALLAAHRDQKLELVRADLVSAMDPELVAASEIDTGSARYHFVLREPQP